MPAPHLGRASSRRQSRRFGRRYELPLAYPPILERVGIVVRDFRIVRGRLVAVETRRTTIVRGWFGPMPACCNNGVTVIDQVEFGPQPPNKTYARVPDAGDRWQAGREPTPGAVNK